MSVRVELRATGSDVERAVARLLVENASLHRTEGVARAEWMMGRMHLYRGQYEDAAALLTRVMRTIGDDDASIRAGVDALEALLLGDALSSITASIADPTIAAIKQWRFRPGTLHGKPVLVLFNLTVNPHVR
jgi:hypothetical protein